MIKSFLLKNLIFQNFDSPKVPRRLNKEDGIERTDEGRKKFDVKDKFVLEPVPADLQAWAEGAGQSHSSKPQERRLVICAFYDLDIVSL